MRFFRNAGLALLTGTVLLGACGGDSNDPTPFDPALFAGDFSTAFESTGDILNGPIGESYALAADELAGMSGPGVPVVRLTPALLRQASSASNRAARDTVRAIAKALLVSPVAGSAVILPDEVLGTTFLWDATEEAYVASERTGAPANGVRLAMYTVNGETGQPAEPLEEIGYLQLTDLSTASTDAARIIVVADGATLFDYSVSAAGSGANATLGSDGYIGNGDDRVEFETDISMSDDGTTETWIMDAAFEFDAVPMTVTYHDEDRWSESSELEEWSMAVRGPHGFVDMAGVYEWESGGDWTDETVYEVNGEEFARYVCTESDCVYSDMDGEPLTEDEENALDMMWGIGEVAFGIMAYTLYPAGLFFF